MHPGSLTLINAGIKNTIPCYGVNGLIDDHLKLFKQYKTKHVFICFDADGPGINAAKSIQTTLENVKLKSHIVTLSGEQDINDFFLLTANEKECFKALLVKADPDRAIDPKPEQHESVTQTEYGFIQSFDDRKYEVRGIAKRDNKLRATIKGITANNRMHVDTIDFYSARSRAFFIKGLCDLFGAKEGVIKKDLEHLLDQTEQYTRQKHEDNSPKQEMIGKDKAGALAFLNNPDMLDEILKDYEILGYTGEKMNKLLCYIACVSRKMESPLSVMIQSRSAAGKSYLQDTVLSLVPDTDFVKYTRLTDQALFYTGSRALKNKILAIEELDGMNGAIYSIRSIQSSKEITIAYTGKDATTGEQKTLENKVEGPIMVFITTTQVDIDGETASRFVFISIDESEDMTKRVLAKQRLNHTMQGMLNKLKSEEIIKKHHNANRLLKPLHVFNPYAELLTFTSKSLRARRDHTKYLNLILAVAYLFQYQRQIQTMEYNGNTLEYINVILDDIEKANTIANYVLGRTLDELSPPSRQLLMIIRQMCKKIDKDPDSLHFNRRQIREHSGWSDFQIRTHIRQLEDMEYIYSIMGKRGKEYVYELVYGGGGENGEPFIIGLTDIKQLKEKAKQAGINYEG
ncbi:MAG: hypothetical protein GY857_01245 [Desulfobacula sp.]|nr:hypothetical protein [Desulfobacula sp.]